MRLKLLAIILSLSFCSSAFAVWEIGGNFSYDKNTYNTDSLDGDGNKLEDDEHLSRTYSGFIAKYLFNLTAIEVNVSHSRYQVTDFMSSDLSGTDYKISKSFTDIETNTWGVGIRQAFASRKSAIVPQLSIGYARRISLTNSYYIFKNKLDDSEIRSENPSSKTSENSLFGTFTLKIRITKHLSLTGSATTFFPAFDFDKAENDVKYAGGFSWMF